MTETLELYLLSPAEVHHKLTEFAETHPKTLHLKPQHLVLHQLHVRWKWSPSLLCHHHFCQWSKTFMWLYSPVGIELDTPACRATHLIIWFSCNSCTMETIKNSCMTEIVAFQVGDNTWRVRQENKNFLLSTAECCTVQLVTACLSVQIIWWIDNSVLHQLWAK